MRKNLCIVLSPLALLLASGCAADMESSSQPRTPEDPSWSDDLNSPAGTPLRTTETLALSSRSSDAPGAANATPPTEKRVRHDVMIAKDAPRSPACSCLAVLAALPGDPRLVWQAEAPRLGGDVVVVAVSGKGVPCPGLADDAPRRASIAGVAQEGADVVVTVEDLPEGRPLATGAVVPRPGPGGGIYVKPKGAKVPYGRPATGAGRCKVR